MHARIPLLLIVGLAAAAQAQTVNLTVDMRTEVSLGRSSCDGTISVEWTNSSPVPSTVGLTCTGPLSLWVTTGTCGKTKVDGDKAFPNIDNEVFRLNASGTSESIRVSELPLFTGADAGSCGSSMVDGEMTVCGAFSAVQGTTCGDVQVSNTPTLTFDAQPPAAPILDRVAGLSGALSVSISPADDDTEQFEVRFAPVGSSNDQFALAGTVARAATSQITIPNLVNNQEYEVRVWSFDDADNQSTTFASGTGRPVLARSFGDLCDVPNCGEGGGCESTSGPVMLLGMACFAALWVGMRRRS